MGKNVLFIDGEAGGANAATRIRWQDDEAQQGKDVSSANCGLPYSIGGTRGEPSYKPKSKVSELQCIAVQDVLENEPFYTVNPELRHVLIRANRVAETDATILIQGESGTGKDLLAQLIYQKSTRRSGPYIEINCSAIPETLFESEMFGYESGTFTGANRFGKSGKFEQAQGGTLFLDEIGELPMEMQAKLLRVLQDHRFYRIGGAVAIQSDARIIAATNRDMIDLLEKKLFRNDLYYRLSVVVLKIPPLRERKDDIPGLIQIFLKKLGKVYRRNILGIERNVMNLLTNYDWPGNVRQLQNILENIVIFMDDDFITTQSLKQANVLDLLQSKSSSEFDQLSRKEFLGTDEVSLDLIMEDHETKVILKALEKCNYNKVKTAAALGIPRSTLYYKMNALGISSRPVVKKNRIRLV